MKYVIRNHEYLEAMESQTLSPFAAKSADFSATRLRPEEEHPYRTALQRDRDRIIHSRAFRRLKHKRQVFLTHYGDHYRTRLTHTLEVSQLSRTLARALGLNEDLVEAIALGHDLGHTPFGHIGEVLLHNIMSGADNLDGIVPNHDEGGYKHNYQSVRVVDLMEKKYDQDGLNLTAAVREGILKHTHLRRDSLNYPDFNMQDLHYELDNATTLEGQIVAVCDEIAQRTHDLEDGIRAGFVKIVQVREIPIIKNVERVFNVKPPHENNDFLYRNFMIRSLINYLMTDVIEATLERMEQFEAKSGRTHFFDTLLVWFGDSVNPLQESLDQFINSEIINAAYEQRSDDRTTKVIRDLFKAMYQFPNLLPEYRLQPFIEPDILDRLYRGPQNGVINAELNRMVRDHPKFFRSVCDQIAGMTDNFAEMEILRVENFIDES